MKTTKAIGERKVVSVEDHPIIVRAIEELCEDLEGVFFVGSASSNAAGLELVKETKPDLVVLDLNLKDGDGFDLIIDIRSVSPGSEVLIFSAVTDMSTAERALRLGVSGYLLKGCEVSVLQDAIQQVLKGERYVDVELSQTYMKRMMGQEKGEDVTLALTDREFQAFRHLASGKKSKDIADILKISPRTVDAHRENIKNKLNCATSTHVILKAREWMQEQLQQGEEGR